MTMPNITHEMSDKDRQLIRHSKIFRGVDIEDLTHLIAECELFSIDAGQTLIHANTHNDHYSIPVVLLVSWNKSYSGAYWPWSRYPNLFRHPLSGPLHD